MPVEKIKIINTTELAEIASNSICGRFSGSAEDRQVMAPAFLCLKVAKGEKFWNRKTKQGTVLYLCLEDNENRLQARLDDLTSESLDNIFLAMA